MDLSAPARMLEEGSSALSAGAGAGIALAAALVVCLAGVLILRVRRSSRILVAGETGKLESGKAHDPEMGEIPECAPEPTPLISKMEFSSCAQKQLGALLRELLEQQVAESLRNGLGSRLDTLEQQVLEAVERKSTGPAPPPAPPPALPTKSAPVTRTSGAQTVTPPLTVHKGTNVQEDFKMQDAAAAAAAATEKPQLELSFGPTMRQQALPDPPEKALQMVRDADSLKSSLVTVRQQLSSRDRQTTELQRQLKECRQALWEQTEEQKASEVRLRSLLTDSSQCPRAQAEEVSRLGKKVEELSTQVSDAKATEIYWCTVAKRQRAYFLQSERMAESGHDCATLIKRHPAGEIFLAPPPIMSEAGDMGPVWDVGSSHANPYLCDSWPFEPNVLAKRSPQEPAMAPLEEDQEESATDDEEASYEDIADSGNERASGLPPMRLPSLPIPNVEDEEDDEDCAGSLLDRLPAMPSDTARSL